VKPKAVPGVTRSASSLAASSPPPVAPSRLPRSLTALIGREEELREVTSLVSSSRLVTLIGGGGVGKTRLALQVAAGLEARYPGRVLFVELAPLADPALLPAFVAAALGLQEAGEVRFDAEGVSAGDRAPGGSPSRHPIQALTGWLLPDPALLVLDNCEHLIEEAAELVQGLLQVCPQLRILATSRLRLGLTGEIAWRVPSLPAPDPVELPADATGAVDQVLQFPAVQLLVERAAMARPGFRLRGSDEALAVARICRRLDGIPLALELAAARVTVLDLGQIAARLDDRFQLLTGGSRAAIPRHQTLRALIDWSYDSLPEAEAALLRRLSVFPGGWTLEAAEAVCSDSTIQNEEVLDRLTALVDRSLVLVEETREGLRYRMQETVREYAREKLREHGEEEAAHAGHLAYFLRLAEAAGPKLRGPDPEATLAQLEAEIDNFRAALAWCETEGEQQEAGTPRREGDGSERPEDRRPQAVDRPDGSQHPSADCPLPSAAEARLRMAAALWPYWEARGHLSEGRQYLRAALQRSGADHGPERAQGVLGAARLALHQGDLHEADTFAQEGHEWFRSRGETRGVAMALLCRGEVAFARGQFGDAESLFAEGLAASRQSGWTQGSARALVKLGAVAMMLADTPRARAPLEEGLHLAETLGDAPTLALALYERGCLAMHEDDDRARALLEESVEIWSRLRHKQATAEALSALGRLAGRQKDRTRAVSFLEQAAATYRELGARIDLAWRLQEVGNTHYTGGAYAEARAAYEESLGIFRELNDPHGIACAANNLGMICFHRGDPAGAQALHREALAIYRSRDHREGVTWSLERLGVVEARHGDPGEAARLMGAAAAARQEMGTPLARPDQADWDQAAAALRAALEPEALEAAWAQAQALPVEAVIAEALQQAPVR
jgi:predicted ATPase